jgi:hypothetical protein
VATTLLKLKPKKSGRAAKKASATLRRCPMVRYRACWCRGICNPIEGRGTCGLLAPHSMQGRTQAAIARYKKAHHGIG